MSRRILVATAGTEGADGALRVARALADRDGSAVTVLAVQEPLSVFASGYVDAIAPITPEMVDAERDALRKRVHAQLERLSVSSADQIVVRTGSVAPTIARVAAECGADLILVGMHGARGIDGWWGREKLLRLVHLAHVPILAIPRESERLPRRAVVAVDFTDFSRHAADEAVREVGEVGHVHLVHVVTPFVWTAGESGMTEWVRTYREGVERRLAELAGELAAASHVFADWEVRAGDPAKELMAVAESTGAELIAIGSHGTGFLGRIILGGVSGRVIRQSHCAVLIAPPRTVPAELGLDLRDDELLAGLGKAGELTLSAGSSPQR